jgi:DNA-binding LytR/AlgR family response regulator
MINCIIIDDDNVASNLLKHYVENTEGLSLLNVLSNAVEAANFIRKNQSAIDLIFLDIEMPEMSGIELLESFKELPPVILISSKEKYAAKAFEYKVLHYLVKPVEYGKFLKAIERVFLLFENEKGRQLDYIFVKENGVLCKVNFTDIFYFEALGDYVKVKVKEKEYVVNSTMKNLEEKLKNNRQFMRVHRSFIINLAFLENFDAETAIVANKIIPIGNKYKPTLSARLNIL